MRSPEGRFSVIVGRLYRITVNPPTSQRNASCYCKGLNIKGSHIRYILFQVDILCETARLARVFLGTSIPK